MRLAVARQADRQAAAGQGQGCRASQAHVQHQAGRRLQHRRGGQRGPHQQAGAAGVEHPQLDVQGLVQAQRAAQRRDQRIQAGTAAQRIPAAGSGQQAGAWPGGRGRGGTGMRDAYSR